MKSKFDCLVMFAVLLLKCGAGAAPSISAEPVAGVRMPVAVDFASSTTRKEISGAACGGQAGRLAWCLAVNDERRWAQFFSIDNGRIVAGKTIGLLPLREGATTYGEIDAEGVAYDDGYFYVVGSHGVSRKEKEFRPSQFQIFRFPVDKRTGRPRFKFSRTGVSPKIERSARLRGLIAYAPNVGPFAEKPLNANGVNIEGLAVRNGRLYLGFRGPSIKGKAFIMEVPVASVFEDGVAVVRMRSLVLGANTGIRDLARVSDGLLVLAGPVNEQKVAWSVYFWSPETNRLSKLAELAGDHGAKAEALTVMSETRRGGVTRYQALVMYDGLRNGRPTVFEFERR